MFGPCTLPISCGFFDVSKNSCVFGEIPPKGNEKASPVLDFLDILRRSHTNNVSVVLFSLASPAYAGCFLQLVRCAGAQPKSSPTQTFRVCESR